MANTILPIAERNLTPAEVDALDHRRRQGHVYLCVGVMMLLVSVFVLMWSGQDATYSPGWHRPMLFWDIILFVGAVAFISRAIAMRRGVNEFFSY